MERPACDRQGFAILIGVLLVGAVAAVTASATLLASLRLSRTAVSLLEGELAREAARACAESALLAIQGDTAYTGSGSETIGSTTCTYTVTDLGGATKQIEAEGISGDNAKRLLLQTNQLSPNINVSSWRDVADF